MDPITERLMTSRDALQTQLTEALTEKKSLEAQISSKDKTISELQAKIANPSLPEGFGSFMEAFGSESFGNFAKLLVKADPHAVKALVENKISAETLNAYIKLGTPSEIDEALDDANELIESYKKVGAEEGETTTPEELAQVIDEADRVLSLYAGLGTVEELTDMKEEYEDMLEKEEETSIAEKATELSSKYKIDVKIVENLLEKFGMENDCEEVIELLKNMKPGSSKNENREDNKGRKASLNEDHEDDDLPRGLRTRAAGRFFESMTAPKVQVQ